MRTPAWCRRQAAGIGACEQVIGELLADNALYRLRSAQGVMPAAAGDGGAAAFLRGPASFANVIPMPGTIPSDAVTPVTAKGAPS